MNPMPHAFKVSLIACSIPSALIALVATAGVWLQWGALSFSNPVYYATLAVAAWCPVSKMVVWRLWRREVKTCVTCVPVNSIKRHVSLLMSVGDSRPLGEPITKG